MRIVVHVEIARLPIKGKIRDFIFVDQLLEAAIARGITTGTEQRMGAEQEHELNAPALDELGSVCGDLHAIPCRVEARRQGASPAPCGDFNHAEPTSSIGYEPLVVTESRNRDARLLSGLQNGSPALDCNFHTVNGQRNHVNVLAEKIVDPLGATSPRGRPLAVELEPPII
jgi:hypothetical protein